MKFFIITFNVYTYAHCALLRLGLFFQIKLKFSSFSTLFHLFFSLICLFFFYISQFYIQNSQFFGPGTAGVRANLFCFVLRSLFSVRSPDDCVIGPVIYQ